MDPVKGFMETGRFDLKEFFKSPPKSSYPSFSLEKVSSADANLQNWTPAEAVNITELENSFFKSILQDDKPLFLATAKLFVTGGGSTINRSVVSKLLHLCCAYDSINCATSLVNGEVGAVPLVNEVDPAAGLSPLHTAAGAHAVRCLELLLKRRARTDLRTRDDRSLLPLELSLSGRRMDVIWNPDDYSVEELVVLLSEKDLTAVKLLTEKTKEVDEVAYANAIDGRIVPLAALLIVAAEKVIDAALELQDTDLGSRQKTTIYECVIKEALSLGRATTTSLGAAKRTCAPSRDDSSEKRKLLLCEVELLQLFGAETAAQSGGTDKKLTSPLIRATQDGDEAIIELLLETNIDINDTDAEGNSALHWSLKMSWGSITDQIRIIWLLVKHAARVTQRNKLGLTAFHFAAANGNSEALQLLLLENPDGVNSKTEMKETPLCFAVKNDHMDCAELLLRWGADSEVLNLRRQRPLELAKSQDMRFMLNSANISFMKRGIPIQHKHPNWLRADEAVSDKCDALLPMTDNDTAMERDSSNKKAEICKYFESPTGCIRGSKCFFAHGEEELRQMKQGTHIIHFPTMQGLKRKIFVGGLPCSLDSDALEKFFGEQFGSVEDAVVIRNQRSDHMQSRGFGFVTFKHERSVLDAVQAHYVSIMGKKVEIKSAIRKSVLLNEPKKLSLRRYVQEDRDGNQLQAQTSYEETINMPGWNTKEEAKSETISCADRLLQGQTKSCTTELQAQGFVHENMSSWLKTFRKWLPYMLEDVSRNGKEGEYPLSSLKGDFRAAFGLELNHASLGYPKLSDFMRSIPDLCHMKVVPIGRRGPATHMVLLPSLSKPPAQRCQPLKVLCPPYDVPADVSGDGDSNDSKCSQDLLLVSGEDISTYSTSIEIGSPSKGLEENYAQKKNSTQKDTAHSASSRFVQFLKPDSLTHAQQLLYKERNVGIGDDDGKGRTEAFKGREFGEWRRHLVLETLVRKQNNTSVFFLREFDFYECYKASILQGKCFWCKQCKLLWANFPCQHLMWCGDCKLHAARAAGNLEHRCVVCDVKVQKIILTPSNVYCQCQPLYKGASNDDGFPPCNATNLRSSLKKKSL